ncbi:hypothetical protein KQI86_07755 [Clostridium sp. MSJ-11]|uniref:Uncharacterized protein n=1 Tax=Clostridium mobile TaxID=2841512 RepID=A0ABS6EHH8_9CLOT|nr:hypothetical protein [Clostridium mobile]MBU5484222.1 hypothetical protein [Clostridium mobile]
MEKYMVTVVELKTQHEIKLVIEADEAETTENIILRAQVKDSLISVFDYNYFSAYQKLRNKILGLGYGIKCNGSRLNAVQSAMMGTSENIYLVELGRQAFTKDIVSLYDYAEISAFPDTQEQTAFFQRWIDSLNQGQS